MKYDPDILRLKAHVDQARAEMRSIVRATDIEDLAALIKRCARGDLAGMDERQQLLVGMLAAVAIFDLGEDGAGRER